LASAAACDTHASASLPGPNNQRFHGHAGIGSASLYERTTRVRPARRSGAAARSASTWSRGVPGVHDVELALCEERAQPRRVGAVAQRVHAARALQLEHRRESGLARARAQRRLGLRRRGRARERDVVAGVALRRGELDHRRGGSGPLPVAGQLENSHPLAFARPRLAARNLQFTPGVARPRARP
jgi:hypothetical protein